MCGGPSWGQSMSAILTELKQARDPRRLQWKEPVDCLLVGGQNQRVAAKLGGNAIAFQRGWQAWNLSALLEMLALYPMSGRDVTDEADCCASLAVQVEAEVILSIVMLSIGPLGV
jgi:hypothetical protein